MIAPGVVAGGGGGAANAAVFANWLQFQVSYPPIQRQAAFGIPAVTAIAWWTGLYTRVLAANFAASNEWQINGTGLGIDVRRLVVLGMYHALLTHATKSPLLATNLRTIVKGQHGTGKSTLFIVIMALFMALRRPFIYSNGDGTYFYWEIDGAGTIHAGTIPANSSAFQDISVTWLMDQKAHGPWNAPHTACKIILVTSDNLDQYKEFYHYAANQINVVCTPLPTDAECDAVGVANGIALATAAERRELYGNVLRIITSRNMDEAEEQLVDALGRCDFNVDVNHPYQVISGSFSHRIFYTDADANFVQRSRRFGSKYIQDRYNYEWNLRRSASLSAFIHLPNPQLGTLQGSAFEVFAHCELQKRRTNVKARLLHPLLSDANIRAGIPIQKRALSLVAGFSNLRQEILLHNNTVNFNNLTNPGGAYLRSKTTNMGACDAIVLDPIATVAADLYQMTINPNHGMNCNELANLITRIDAYHAANPQAVLATTIRLFYVVPYFKAEQFQRQTYTGLLTSTLTPAQLDRIEMYSMGVDI